MVPNADVIVELAASVVVGKIEEVTVLCAVEGCSDVNGLVFKPVCAAVDGITSKYHLPGLTSRRSEPALTRCGKKHRVRR